jgi:hypothetical protein
MGDEENQMFATTLANSRRGMRNLGVAAILGAFPIGFLFLPAGVGLAVLGILAIVWHRSGGPA